MTLIATHEHGTPIVEGRPGQPSMRTPDDAALVVEACLSARTRAALLYPANLTARFFDLSSEEAGAILDKLRRFRISFAVVCAPRAVEFSARFTELRADDLRIFDDRRAAVAWLDRPSAGHAR